jgi:tRNA(Ile)-lysidine synthase
MNISKTIKVRPGKYVLAVSGGVDSMALLDVLKTRPDLKLTVAHFDHGMREDSHLDRKLVQDVATANGLPFVFHKGELGTDAGETAARKARYEFLRKVKEQTKAHAIITAHHQDDAIETAVHNVLRGTGRAGMSSLENRATDIVRPLLHLPKVHLVAYATSRGIKWREDPTNTDTGIRRNHIRHDLLPKLKAQSPRDYAKLQRLVRRQALVNRAIDEQLTHLLHLQDEAGSLDRHGFIMLPHTISRELLAHWLRVSGSRQFSRKQLDHLATRLKTGRPGSKHAIDDVNHFTIDGKLIRLRSN